MKNQTLNAAEFILLLLNPDLEECLHDGSIGKVTGDVVIDWTDRIIALLDLREITFAGKVGIRSNTHIANINIYNCNFQKGLEFSHCCLDNLSLTKCHIDGDLIVTHTCEIISFNFGSTTWISGHCVLGCHNPLFSQAPSAVGISFDKDVCLENGVTISPTLQASYVKTSDVVLATQFHLFGVRTIVPYETVRDHVDELINGPGMRH